MSDFERSGCKGMFQFYLYTLGGAFVGLLLTNVDNELIAGFGTLLMVVGIIVAAIVSFLAVLSG